MHLYLNFITFNIYITLFGLTLLCNVASLNPDIRNVSVYCKVETQPQETQSRVGRILQEFYRNFTRRNSAHWKFCTQEFYPRNFARRNSTGRKFAGSSPVHPKHFFLLLFFFTYFEQVLCIGMQNSYGQISFFGLRADLRPAKFLRAKFLKLDFRGQISTGRFPVF